MLSYIIWNVQAEIVSGWPPRWYGLLFAMGFLIGQFIVGWMFKVENKPEKDLEKLMIYMVVATILGARLGHCLFYQPGYYLSNPIEILKIWEGGLASHGAAIGISIALYLYSRKRKGQSFLWVLDRIVVVVALGGAFIRFGNLMNSEIIGKPTDQPWAFMFVHTLDDQLSNYESVHFTYAEKERSSKADTIVDGTTLVPLKVKLHFDKKKTNEAAVQQLVSANLPSIINNTSLNEHFRMLDQSPSFDVDSNREDIVASLNLHAVPRHPAQLYESISTFLIFLFLLALYAQMREKTPEGLFFGIFMIGVFTLRFLFEYLKENQVSWEDGNLLNQGQILSIPAILVGFAVLIYALKNRNKPKDPEAI